MVRFLESPDPHGMVEADGAGPGPPPGAPTPRSRAMAALVTMVLAALAVISALALWIRWMEPRMTYFPSRILETTPSSLGWRFEELRLEASDGVGLHGWFIPRPAEAIGPPFTVLFLHGNAGNISHRLEKLAILRGLGANVLILDYRGYGRSAGRPGEQGLYRDARAAYDHLIVRRRVDPRRVVLYGESLGAAVAVHLGSEVEVGALVLEEAFTSAAEVGQTMFPFLPMRLLVGHRYDSLRAMGRLRAPTLVLHSRDDEYFPLRHAERLVAAAGSNARLVVLRGGHNEAFRVSEPSYRRALQVFFAERERKSS